MLKDKKRKPTTVSVTIGALKFLDNVTLNGPEVMQWIRTVRVEHPQPVVLSGSEVQGLLEHATSRKHRAHLMLIYGAGRRMRLHVRKTKNRYDCVLSLSPVLLTTLRDYHGTATVIVVLLFARRRGDVPITRNAINRAIVQAVHSAGLNKRVHPHLFAMRLRRICSRCTRGAKD